MFASTAQVASAGGAASPDTGVQVAVLAMALQSERSLVNILA
jgi:hypothetical protein